jgi:hypothetical protein
VPTEGQIRKAVAILKAWDSGEDSLTSFRSLAAQVYREMTGAELPRELAEEALA